MEKKKAIKDLKIERPRRAVVSEKEDLKRMKDFSNERSNFLPLLERARVEVYVPDQPAPHYRNLLLSFEDGFHYDE